MSTSSALIVGCGYLGRRVADRLGSRGIRVSATTRSHGRAAEFERAGLSSVILDVCSPPKLPAFERVFYSVALDRRSGRSMREVYVGGLLAFLEALPSTATRFVYASSTSVYGITDGSWVDENTPAEPMGGSGKVCLEAEEALKAWAVRTGSGLTILRYSGLYGPDRVIRRGAIERGEPIACDPDTHLNLIHIDDAATAAVAALMAESPPPLVLVSDGRPILRRDYYGLLARLLNAPPPDFQKPEVPDGDRRIHGQLLREALVAKLAYGDTTIGLPACL
jgi:nucleoside-diphosphate-sugar epimerase